MPSSFDPNSFLMLLIVAVIAITIHEFAHAITADSLGDSTARNQGRITLNPLAHFDPLGFFMLCLLAAGFFGFAWGRPVPVNPYALRGGRRGMALVAIAGPLSNLMQAAVAVGLMRVLGNSADPNLLVFVSEYVRLNLLLAAFNMIPVPPLDGYNVLMGLVSNFWVQRLEPLRQQGPILLLLLVFVGGSIIYPVTVEPMYYLFSRIVGAPV
ncbi:MAG: site-2 protease family protein [Chloroflexota bacterium]|nr:site-2 protease family protein [Chloroflexota bacterium]